MLLWGGGGEGVLQDNLRMTTELMMKIIMAFANS